MLQPTDPSTAAAAGPVLEGVNVGGDAARVVPLGQVAYRVVETPPAAPAAPAGPAAAEERREEPRQRTRLRSGKIADLGDNFITECVVHNRSPKGAWLRLVRDVAVPPRIRLYDDEQRTLVEAKVVRRRGPEIGVRLLPDTERKADASPALGEKYYAMGR